MKTLTDWDKLSSIEDFEIDYSDIPSTDNHFWENPVVVKPKKSVDITISLDEDLADWVKSLSLKSNRILNTIFRAFYTISTEKTK